MRRLLLMAMLAPGIVWAETTITIQADKPGIKVSPMLYGIFFEEINRAGDGGIYAEMIQNRSFEDADKPVAWTPTGKGGIALEKSKPLNAHNPTSLKLTGPVGVANDGFGDGLHIENGKKYDLSLYARGKGRLNVSLVTKDGQMLAGGEFAVASDEWKKFNATWEATAADPNARLSLNCAGGETIWVDMVSLFPHETWKGHGLRTDLMEMIAAMKPAFVRFPGGCYVEGDRLENAFRWKKSIGDIAERPGHWNLWGYRSNDGLGFHEYLQMCEDLGAEPVFVINCGMSHKGIVPMDKMQEFVQDALDAIEYANGPVSSPWGALRAKAGHPEPFNMKTMEIGNENGGPEYHQRYALFHDAIKAKYPDFKLIACDWNGLPKNRPLDLIDSHQYDSPAAFQRDAARYDHYDRKGPKVYFGEYAVTKECGGGNLQAAVGEAAFMTGLERNSDVVTMSSYAPLLVHPKWKRWNPNAIVFDQAQAYGTPSYWVQTMFGQNRADDVLPVRIEETGASIAGMVGIGTWGTQAEFKDMKVTAGNGRVLLEGSAPFNPVNGRWGDIKGVLRQTSDERAAQQLAGDSAWTDYTFSLKARKLGGKEGFLIIFGQQTGQRSWWNIGGWDNKESGIQSPGLPEEHVPLSIKNGYWYDIVVDVAGSTVRCYLDGQLIHKATRAAPKSLFAVAGHKGSDVIVKVVNAGADARDAIIQLRGMQPVARTGTAIVLTSDNPNDENAFAEPAKVAPKEERLTGLSAGFKRRLPGNSVTILKLSP